MANSIPKKRAKAEQLRERRAQAAVGLATGAKKPVAAVPNRIQATEAVSEPR